MSFPWTQNLQDKSTEEVVLYLSVALKGFEAWSALGHAGQSKAWAKQYNDIEEELVRRDYY